MEQIESRFELPHQSITFPPNYNIIVGKFAPIITDDKPHEIQLFKFGLTPFWAKKEMLIANARAEGEYNKEDYPDFKGAKGIILKPAFRKPIRSQRCLVLASAFIEGIQESRLSIPYLVYLRNHKNPFAFAGIWDTWLNPKTGFPVNSFCIITTTANSLMQKLGHLRMPVILSDNEEKRWIKPNAELTNITCLLNRYDSKLMNAYPIDPKIKNPAENDKQLIQPIGERVLIEEKRAFIKFPHTSGYHQARRANKEADTSTMSERYEYSKAKEK
jgi:putative SOS response-associated peptidase YedK